MSFSTFLSNTPLKSWYPLKHLGGSRSKILNLLNLRTDKAGNKVEYDNNQFEHNVVMTTTRRKHFRVCVVGAGLSGLGCAQELLRMGKKKNIKIEIMMYEGKNSRKFKCKSNSLMQSNTLCFYHRTRSHRRSSSNELH